MYMQATLLLLPQQQCHCSCSATIAKASCVHVIMSHKPQLVDQHRKLCAWQLCNETRLLLAACTQSKLGTKELRTWEAAQRRAAEEDIKELEAQAAAEAMLQEATQVLSQPHVSLLKNL